MYFDRRRSAVTRRPEPGEATTAALMDQVRARAEDGQHRWPSDGLDVPADAEGRAHYAVLRDVQRVFREVAYRTRLDAVPGSTPPQDALIADAMARAHVLLLGP